MQFTTNQNAHTIPSKKVWFVNMIISAKKYPSTRHHNQSVFILSDDTQLETALGDSPYSYWRISERQSTEPLNGSRESAAVLVQDKGKYLPLPDSFPFDALDHQSVVVDANSSSVSVMFDLSISEDSILWCVLLIMWCEQFGGIKGQIVSGNQIQVSIWYTVGRQTDVNHSSMAQLQRYSRIQNKYPSVPTLLSMSVDWSNRAGIGQACHLLGESVWEWGDGIEIVFVSDKDFRTGKLKIGTPIKNDRY